MKPTIIFKRDSKNVKEPFYLKSGVFLIYAPRKLKINPMQFERFDAEITVTLPKHFQGHYTSKFKIDEIEQMCGHEQRVWIGILSRSLTNEIIVKKDKPFGFFVLEPGLNKEKINIKHETAKKYTSKISKKKPKRCFF